MDNAPKKFLSLYLPDFVANAVDTITNTRPGAKVLEWLVSKFGNGGKRYASFLRIGKSRNQAEVFENLLQQYDDDTMQFTALTMYMEELGAGNSVSGFEGQIEEILTVKKRYPDRLKIFFGVDPRWKGSGTELRKAVQTYFESKLYVTASRSVYPFCGLKLYPSTGFYVFDEKLKETFEWAADAGVPVLSHCNYLGGIYNNNKDFLKANLDPKIPYSNKLYSDYCKNSLQVAPPAYIQKTNLFKWLTGTNSAANNKYTCSYYLEPASYKPVLEYFDTKNKPLKICLAHFGGDEQVRALKDIGSIDAVQKKPYGVMGTNWFAQVQEILTNHPSAYTDISYALFDNKIHNALLAEANNSRYGNRVMFGTDYFLTEQEQPEKDTYNNFKTRAIATPLSNFGNITAWDQLAGISTQNFLESKYC
jgi:predicted TIM-barrel fold metal-dependent hydrolase